MELTKALTKPTKQPERVFYNGVHVGWKIGQELILSEYSDVEFLDNLIHELKQALKTYKAIQLKETGRDRIFFVLPSGDRVYFGFDNFTYQYVFVKFFADKTVDAMDLHFGVLGFKYLNHIVDEEHLNKAVEYIWEEAVK